MRLSGFLIDIFLEFSFELFESFGIFFEKAVSRREWFCSSNEIQ